MQQVNVQMSDEDYKLLIKKCGKRQMVSGEIVKPSVLARELLSTLLNEQDNSHNITMKSKSVIIPDFKKNSIQDSEPVSIPIVNEDNMSDSEVANSFNDLNYDF